MTTTLSGGEILALVEGRHGAPYSILGPHDKEDGGGFVVRALQPRARRVDVIDLDKGGVEVGPMRMIHDAGLFELEMNDVGRFRYQLRMQDNDGHTWQTEDAYRFPLQITDFDLYLFGEGSHHRTYEKMGAHVMALEGVQGVHFAVWAPNAERVSVVGVFNCWDGRAHPMERRGNSGLWELFIPGMQSGDLYKFELRDRRGNIFLKADPYAFFSEVRPKSASVVWDLNAYAWTDDAWIKMRAQTAWHARPMRVYEVHGASWRAGPDGQLMTYRAWVEQLIPYVKEMGYTHIEFLPLSEHPFDGSWGYQTIGYYAITSRFGTPDDFRFFVNECHRQGIGVLLDWVPAHFPKDAHGLARFDGTHLYEHADPRQGEHSDWGTLIFNYGRNEVRDFLLSNAIFLADKFHVDGLRVDAVASMLYLDYSRKEGEWIPNQFGGRENLDAVDFLKRFNEVVHKEYPGFLTFAEESTAWPMVSRPVYLGGLGFDFKWNMGWMHDTLKYMSKECIFRKYHHHELTFSLIYAFNENFILPFSHDEVVHGKGSLINKMPGDYWQKFAGLRVLYAYMWAHPGKKLMFMGQEFGQFNEWDFSRELDWNLLGYESHRRLQTLVKTLNRLSDENPALYAIDFTPDGFEWIDLHNADDSVVVFARKGLKPSDLLVCACNFTPVPREGYRFGLPCPGRYSVLLNTDDAQFGGSDVRTPQELTSECIPWHGREQSVALTLPPLAALWLRYEGG